MELNYKCFNEKLLNGLDGCPHWKWGFCCKDEPCSYKALKIPRGFDKKLRGKLPALLRRAPKTNHGPVRY